MKKLIILLMLCLAANVSYAKSHKLELNLEVGKTYELTSKVDMDTQMMMMNVKMAMTGTLEFIVKDFKNSQYTIHTRYKTISLSIGGMGQELEMNSDSDQKEFQFMKYFTTQIFVMKLDRLGSIKDLKIESSSNKAFDTYFEGMSEEQKTMMKSQAKDSFGPESVKSTFAQTLQIFPKTKVSVGDSWSRSSEVKTMYKMKRNSTYILKDVTSSTYVIEEKSKVTTGDILANMPGSDKKMGIDIKGTSTSVIVIDKKSCWVNNVKANAQISGKMKMGNPGAAAQQMEVPMIMKMKAVTTGKVAK